LNKKKNIQKAAIFAAFYWDASCMAFNLTAKARYGDM